MDNSNEELLRFLNGSGKLAMLRKYVISFLLTVEGLTAEVDTFEDHDREKGAKLIRNIELHLNQLTLCQKSADKMLLEMEKMRRQALYREAPEVLKLFGWHDKINEAGEMVGKL